MERETPYIPEEAKDKEISVERNGYITNIETPTATYVIVYGDHGTADNPDSIPPNTDGVFLELSDDWSKFNNGYRELEDNVQYKKVLLRLPSKNIPIYFADPDVNATIALPLDFGTTIAETAIGIALFSKMHEQKTEPAKMGRRDFLKKLGLAAAGTYLAAPMVSQIVRTIGHDTNLGAGATSELLKKTNQVHPEIMPIIASFRNAIIAYKEQWLADKREDKPKFVSIMGAMHVGIEDSFQTSQEEKLDFIKKFKPYLNTLIDTPETFYTIRENDPYGNGKSFVIPELKELWENT